MVQDPDGLVSGFIDARVLALRPDRRIAFRYRAFLEYFIACEMRFKEAFKTWVLEEQRYLRYINEIQNYAGMDRDDVALLDLVGERFEKLLQDVIQGMNWSPDLSLIENFGCLPKTRRMTCGRNLRAKCKRHHSHPRNATRLSSEIYHRTQNHAKKSLVLR